ncbi:MAG: P-loop NTPase [Pseudomonadota bacterium]
MIDRMRDAARKGRAEAAIRRVLKAEAAGGNIALRSRDGVLTATVLLSAPVSDAAALEAKLLKETGLERITLVESSHGQEAPAPKAAPPPTKSGGGHADPLRLGAKAPPTPGLRPEPRRPDGVARVVAVASGKGGVGKSTVAAGLALSLAKSGARVGLLDLDIHGPSLPVLFPVKERLKAENGKIIPAETAGLKLVSIGYMVDERQAVAWRGPMVMNAARQLIEDTKWGDLDVLIVDTPPGTGDAHLSLVQRLKLDGALLVATPSPLATADVRRGAALFDKVGAPLLGLILNMTGGPLGDDLDPALIAEIGTDIALRLPLTTDLAATPATFRPEFGPAAERIAELLRDTGAAKH